MSVKKAFVTGASEGLGRTFALQLAALGYEVTAVARNESRLQELMPVLQSTNALQHSYQVADLSTDEGIQACQQCLRESHFNVLVNNAGISYFGQFGEKPLQDDLRILKVNCESLMALAHTFIGEAASGDALINLSSLTYNLPTPIQPSYVATKNFIGSFSESLWYQQRDRGVYVQGLCPGITRTQFLERSSNLEGFKMQFLDAISQSPEAVVKASLKALKAKRGPIIIPGIGNKLLSIFITLMPRRLSVWLMGKTGGLAEE